MWNRASYGTLRARASGAMEQFDAFLARFGDSPLVQSAVILAVTLLLAWVAHRLLAFGVGLVARRTRSDVDDRVIDLLERPVRVSVVLAGLALVTVRLDPSGLLGAGGLDLTRLTLGLLATLAILLWASAAVRLSALLLDAVSGRRRFVQSRTLPLFRNLASIVIVGVAIYFVFIAWGIDVSAWLASAGIVGIAVGFAAKDTLANLFAGLFILTDAPYKVGDIITLEGGERGQVTRVGIRSTRIITRDDVEITIPNAVIADARIVNESGGRWSKERLRVKLNLPYGIDLERIRGLLVELARAEPDVSREPEPRVRVRGFGQLGIEVELLAWIEQPVDRGRVSDALYSAIYRKFVEESIDVPFAQRAPAPWSDGAPGAAGTTPPATEPPVVAAEPVSS